MLSVLDGRYSHKVENLKKYATEEALILKRIFVEFEYFKLLSSIIPELFYVSDSLLFEFESNITSCDIINEVKNIEKITKHDIKAIEYFLIKKYPRKNDNPLKIKESNFIHFGLTSDDINSTAYILLFRSAIFDEFIPKLSLLINKIQEFSINNEQIFMISKTHGQNATPTSLGYQIQVFVERLNIQKKKLEKLNKKQTVKFGGATGGLNVHYYCYPEIKWNEILTNWCKIKFNLIRNTFTTQVDHNDNYSEILDLIKRINVILLDFSRDIWLYISLDYIIQKPKEEEIGSSTMPHKINPIDFENAEGNLKISISQCNFLSENLGISRLQRDLSNSTIFRNVFQPIGYSLIAFDSLINGISKIEPNFIKLENDLKSCWELIAEPIVCQLKVWGIPDSYSKLKEITRRNKKITEEELKEWIETRDYLSIEQKDKLKELRPENYKPFKLNY